MEYLESLSIFPYVLSVVFATWITIRILIPVPSKLITTNHKLIISLFWGIGLGVVWYFFVKSELDLLILGFFASAGLYDKIIKHILAKFNIK